MNTEKGALGCSHGFHSTRMCIGLPWEQPMSSGVLMGMGSFRAKS